MATRSIFETVDITEKQIAERFLTCIEKAYDMAQPLGSVIFTEASLSDIRELCCLARHIRSKR